jgi:hypothetical protein
MQSEMAQRTQREAAAEASRAAARASEAAATRERVTATPADILKAREVASLEQQKAQLVAEGGSPAQIAAIDAQLSVLRPQRAAEAAPESVRVAQSIAKLLEERDTLSAAPDQTPQTARKIQIIDAQLAQLQKQEKPESIPAQISLANAIADAQEQVFALQSQPASATRDEQLRRASARLNALERQLPKEPATPRGPSVGAEREAEALAQYGKQFADLTQEQQRIVNQRVSAEQGSRAAATAPQIRIENKGLEAFAQSRGKTQAELLNEATLSARGASQALTTISSMKQLNASGQLFTGPLANPVLGASSLLASVGLISADQRNRLTSSEIYDKQAKDLVMQDLGGKLGAQISDADRKFVEARIPQLTTSAQARTELLNKLEEIQRGKIDFYRRANAHANQFGNLNTFDFSQQYSPVTPAGGWSIRRVESAR